MSDLQTSILHSPSSSSGLAASSDLLLSRVVMIAGEGERERGRESERGRAGEDAEERGGV